MDRLVLWTPGATVGVDTIVRGNFIGTDVTGTEERPRGSRGIYVSGESTRVVIGSVAGGLLNEAHVNLISGQDYDGITLSEVSQVTVRGNLIGTTASGFEALGNGARGITASYLTNSTIQENLISANTYAGVYVIDGCSGVTLRGNSIGTTADGEGALPNHEPGILVAPGSGSNRLIQDILIEENLVAFNQCNNCSAGIVVARQFYQHNGRHPMLGNYVHLTRAWSRLAELDVSGNLYGVTANDPDDPDTGANNLQNFPVITSAVAGPGNLTIHYALDSEPSANFKLQFFRADACDASGHGGAREFLGFADVATDAMGDVAGQVVIAPGAVSGALTATATNTVNGTSEFSSAICRAAKASSRTASSRVYPDCCYAPTGTQKRCECDSELGVDHGGPRFRF
jgi:parallel beta-helix repeat protein